MSPLSPKPSTITHVDEPGLRQHKQSGALIPKDLDHLIQLIHQELGTDKGLGYDDIDVGKIQALMASYDSNELDWEKFALW